MNATALRTTFAAPCRLFWARSLRPSPPCCRPSSSASGSRVGAPALPGDGDRVRYYDLHGKVQFTTFGELKVIAAEAKASKNRDLIRVDYGTDVVAEPTPTFRLLQPNELETLVRKTRHHREHQYFARVEPGSSMADAAASRRIHEKMVRIKVGVSDHDLDVVVAKVRKWLKPGNTFVNLIISSGSHKAGEEAKALEAQIRAKLLTHDQLDLSKLSVKFS